MTERYSTIRRYVFNVFKDLYGHNISFRTYLRYCRRIGAIRAPNAKKESLTLRHRKMRIAWCRVRKFWKMEQWKKVIFSDECCIKIGQDRRVYVWKMKDEGYYRPDLYGDNKKPKMQVMIWGCISWFGVGTISMIDGTLNSRGYLQILEDKLWPVVAKHFPGGDYLFQDDGASIHTAHIIKDYKANNGMGILPWPAKSPDLNIIENLWHILKLNIQKQVHTLKTVEDLKNLVENCWNSITTNYIRNLYNSLPRRMKRVTILKGHRTKY